MKIAWFTPFHRKSAIARFSRDVAHALAGQGHRVDIWTADDGDLCQTSLRIVPFRGMQRYEIWLREYDYVFYNLGDHYPNHGSIYDASKKHPGIVILHDFVMHHFFASYYWERRLFQRYCDVMKRWYGADLTAVDGGWSGEPDRVWEREEVMQYPLFEEAIVGAEAVVVHSQFFTERIAQTGLAPVRAIPLAYTAQGGNTLRKYGDGRILLLTTGHVNENKRIHTVLDALARSPELCGKVRYVIAGPCDSAYAADLKQRCAEPGLKDTVQFTGYIEDGELGDYLASAGICINLRWPAMEGGSASCAEQMLLGKPIIVTNTGVYAELPDDCVCKVRPEYEAEDLVRHLTELCGSRKKRTKLGDRARRFAQTNFDPAIYARRLSEYCASLMNHKPVIRLADTVAAELRAIGVSPEMSIVDTVARRSLELFEGDYKPPILWPEEQFQKVSGSSS